MLLSRTGEYALQALIYLAVQSPEQPVLSREVAQYLGVPASYLAKILKDLAKHGLVSSYRGRGGGFQIRRGTLRMPILRVLEMVEGRDKFEGCLLGLKKCADETACPVHYLWKPLKQEVLAMLERHTIGSMADEVRAGRYRLRVTELELSRRVPARLRRPEMARAASLGQALRVEAGARRRSDEPGRPPRGSPGAH